MNHPLVVATASFFAVALLARYASATHPVALVTAFPFAIFVYAQLRIQNQLGCPKKRGRRWAWFIYFFIFVYAFAGLPYLVTELAGDIPRQSARILALFITGFGLAGVALGRLSVARTDEADES